MAFILGSRQRDSVTRVVGKSSCKDSCIKAKEYGRNVVAL